METSTNIFEGAQRLKSMPASLIRMVLNRVAEMKEEGRTIIPLVAGEPNFNTPQAIKDAAAAAIQANYTHYTSNRGLPKLREEIAKRTLRETGLSYDPETEILVTTSGAEAINNSLISHLDPGDEVIIFSPAFINYENVVRIAGAVPVFIELEQKNGFQIDVEQVRAKLTPKTKMIVLNNPCNPTGVLHTPETLESLSRLICENNLIAFADEIYSSLAYTGPFRSLASFPGMRERTIMMNGFSKAFAMTGWRLGYVCADSRMISNMLKIHQYTTTCSPTFIQVGLSETMNTQPVLNDMEQMFQKFSQRRNLAMQGLDRIPNLSYATPGGAFYIFINVAKTGLTGEEFCSRLLEECSVAAVPGLGFGSAYSDFIRISYATSEENILEGMKRMKDFAASL